MKDIYTVIIISADGTDLSTAAFYKFEDAIAYCLEELRNAGDGYDEDLDMIQEELIDKRYYDDYGTTYYIEETKLM